MILVACLSVGDSSIIPRWENFHSHATLLLGVQACAHMKAFISLKPRDPLGIRLPRTRSSSTWIHLALGVSDLLTVKQNLRNSYWKQCWRIVRAAGLRTGHHVDHRGVWTQCPPHHSPCKHMSACIYGYMYGRCLRRSKEAVRSLEDGVTVICTYTDKWTELYDFLLIL